jgi:hypothetical protein
MEKELRHLLGSYNKANIDIGKFNFCIKDAVKRAKKIDQQHGRRWPENPGTHVFQVVEAIWELRPTLERV